MYSVFTLCVAALAAAALAGCADRYAAEGFDGASAIAAPAAGSRPVWIRTDADEQAARKQIDAIRAQPLTADGAVEIALVNNRALQAAFAELGIKAADLAEVSRPPNPGVSFKRVGSGDVDIERQIGTNVLDLLTRPIAYGIESRRFEAAKLRAAGEILTVARSTRRAFFAAVAGAQAAGYAAEARRSADAQLDLARRMKDAGNWSALDLAREQLLHAETIARSERTTLMAQAARERLARLMGLAAAPRFDLPEKLPDLPAAPAEADGIEAKAIAERLDVRAAKAETAALAESLGLTRATRMIDVLEGSYVRSTGTTNGDGYEIRLEVPIFDFGAARVARAESLYMRSVNRLADAANGARSEAREAGARYRAAWTLAKRYRDEIVPARKRVSDEMLLRYNGMLASVFELLADARDRMAATTAAIEAQRDFWLADNSLRFVTLIGDGASADMRDAATAE